MARQVRILDSYDVIGFCVESDKKKSKKKECDDLIFLCIYCENRRKEFVIERGGFIRKLREYLIRGGTAYNEKGIFIVDKSIFDFIKSHCERYCSERFSKTMREHKLWAGYRVFLPEKLVQRETVKVSKNS